MRIVFMGTPEFAAASLRALFARGFDVVGVFTQPDKPSGRGMETVFSPVKKLAIDTGVPLFQPNTLRDGEAVRTIQELRPDVIVVVAYGRILPDEVLAIPAMGAINVHGSLLPRYRGAAPIQWAVLNGDSVTGVSTMYLAHEMDSGDVIYSEETPIGEFETSGELFSRLMEMGARLLVKTLEDMERGIAPRIPQDPSKVSYARMLDRSLSPIDWNRSPREIIKQIYGLQPWPVATAEINGVLCKIFAAEYTETHVDAQPGALLAANEKGIEVACGMRQSVRITQLQAPGKKRMSAADYLRGHPISVRP